MTAVRLGGVLFPGCRSMADIEGAVRSEKNATACNQWRCAVRLLRVLRLVDVLDLYRKPREVVRWIDSGRDSPPAAASKMTFYAALAALANPAKFPEIASRVPPASRAMFLGKASSLGKVVREEHATNELDARERAAILPWPDIVSAYKKIRGTLGDSQRVIAALYLAGGSDPGGAPRRLDYNAVRVYMGRAPDDVPRNLNYVVVRSADHVELVLQEFKTSKFYGPYRTRLPPAVAKVVHESVRRRPRKWLIHGADGKPLPPSGFGHQVSSTMKQLTGRAIGVSNLRKSYVTWLYSRRSVPRPLGAYAAAMNHSPAEQLVYRRKNIRSPRRIY